MKLRPLGWPATNSSLSTKVSYNFYERAQSLTSHFTAVKRAVDASSIPDKTTAYEGYLKAVSGKSNSEARIVAQDILGQPVFWDWDRECIIYRQTSSLLSLVLSS